MKDLGVPVSLLGYTYIRRAIELVVDKQSLVHQITKILYPAIAKEFDTKATRVERAIRHAIEVSCERGNTELLQELFRYSYSPSKGKPTNGEFIATIAEYISIKRGDIK